MLVAGMDEVGRGSIAGPLLVVAAMFEVASWEWDGNANGFGPSFWTPKTPCPVAGVKDSKMFSSRARREAVSTAILAEPTLKGHGRGVVSSVDISGRGMGWALRVAFLRALKSLPTVPDLVLIDGEVPARGWEGKQFCRPKADVHWWPVSAASVLAKVERDNWMVALDKIYPGYGWDSNSGYGTPSHSAAIQAKGTTPIHRLGFIHVGAKKADDGSATDGTALEPAS